MSKSSLVLLLPYCIEWKYPNICSSHVSKSYLYWSATCRMSYIKHSSQWRNGLTKAVFKAYKFCAIMVGFVLRIHSGASSLTDSELKTNGCTCKRHGWHHPLCGKRYSYLYMLQIRRGSFKKSVAILFAIKPWTRLHRNLTYREREITSITPCPSHTRKLKAVFAWTWPRFDDTLNRLRTFC